MNVLLLKNKSKNSSVREIKVNAIDLREQKVLNKRDHWMKLTQHQLQNVEMELMTTITGNVVAKNLWLEILLSILVQFPSYTRIDQSPLYPPKASLVIIALYGI